MCRSRRELSHEYLVFTCKLWLSGRRERALKSLPALRVQIPQVRWATNRCCPEGHKEASGATRAPPDRDDTVASDLRDEEEVIDEEAQIARHYGVDRPTIRAIIRPTADRFEHFFRPDIELQLARSSLRQEQREARAQRQRFFRLVRAA